MKLETERLYYREVELSDREDIFSMQTSAEYKKFFPWDIRSEEYIKEIVAMFIDWQGTSPRVNYQFIVFLKEDNRFVGTCGIHYGDSKNRSAEIGVRLASEFWGKGYATEISKALFEFGFNDLNLHRITAETIADNIPAAELCNRLGMKYEGRFREHKFRNERWYDSLRFAILDNEWRAK